MGNGSNPGPGVQRRRLRAELRSARQKEGLTQEQVAAEMDWSLSKVIRIEAGSVGISTNDLKALLRLYKILNEEQTADLIALARAGRERSWQSAYRDVVSPRLLQLIEYESAASIIRNFEPLVVPGLLQTEEYARAVLGRFAVPTTPGRIDAQVEVRMRRQELVDADDPPLLFFILDEAVTRRMVGGAAVMRRQVRKLVEFARRPRVTLEIVPFGAGVHPGLQGPFVIYEFPDPADDDVLFLENPLGDVSSRDSPDEVLRYREAFEELRKLSLGRDGSLTYLDNLAKEMS
jgi:transcriptional regulator with XRE-family HTH domain